MNRNELEKMIAYLKQNSKKNASILKDLQTHGDWFIRQQSVQRIYDKKNGTKSDFDIQQVLTTRQDKSGMKLHSVMDADSGQIAAIEMAKAGKSFVLEGPPGTGKSQTIANMIAEFFADGKKVLFVSEKEAGMHIVLHKLDMVGLGDYCLQMHSQDTDEKKILGDIYHTLHLPVFPPVLDKADGRERWEEAAHTLDEYQKQVHQVDVRCGRSLWQLYEEYSGMKGIPDVNYYSAHLNIPESAEEDSTATLLEEYADLVPDVSYDYHLCPWYGFIGSDTSAESMHQIVKTLKHFIQRLEEMIRLSSEIPNLLGISISSCADMYQSRAVIDFMAEDDLITAEFFDDKKLHELTDALTLMEKLSEEQKEMEAKLFLSYRAEVIALDGQELLQELQQYGGHLTKNLNKEYRNLISRLRSYRLDGRKPGYTEASGDLQLLADYQRSREKADVTGKVLDGHTGVLYQGISSDWEKIKRELEKFQELRNTGADFGRFLKLEGARFEGLRRICKIWSAGMKEMDRKWPDQGDTLQDLFDPEIVSFQEMNMKKLLSKLKNCLAQTDMLDSWIRMHDVLNQLKSHGDLGFLNAMIDQGISEKQFVPCYRKNCLRGWIDYLRHTLPEVAAFTREGHDRMVKTFRIEERVQFDRNRRQISAFLSSRRPSVEASEAGSRVSGFMLEERSGRPLQEVLALYSDLVTDCKPCFMVSPQSASCFLRPEDVHFDVVIFDEASQITVEEGLPCIGRADQVIVAG
ncbi:MAG: hypothetical protein LIV24_01770, partial [Eubacterium sp.]|nr:hypothetical protein [Eubacterium sp.]